jgi:hypothetical protein
VQWSQKEQPEPAREFVQQVLPIIIASLKTSVDEAQFPHI